MQQARERAQVSGSPALPPPEIVLVRYGELALKGGNRRQFEDRLAQNIRDATARISGVRVERRRGRLAVFPERRTEDVAFRLQEVFGIKSVSPAWGSPSEPDAIARCAQPVLVDALAALPPDREVTFRVHTSRGDKLFPLNSIELDRYVAERIMPGLGRLRVRLDDPELALGIDVRAERSYVFVRRLPGPGGLPVGTLGRALCLLSGGIDSPVAAWMSMKRGLHVGFITFHSYPFVGDASKRKVVEVARLLARWQQPESRLFVVPFTEIQTAIRDAAPESYRTVLYRRFMQRIAARVAAENRLAALITGESLGQVASQTLENIACIEAAADAQVLRPLIGFDKEDTVAVARRIGTFDVSSRQEPDCCSVFMPERPVLRGKIEACEAAEAGLDLAGLIDRACAGIETIELDPEA
ncbi:MAG TPA: tRNA uracil 4-sulfurtransferase ThiI [Planctomycetota bacterium]|nr:tRNA uracil 4-sulfurtransferase ThiI [Planctomycetota bacterium]